MPSTLRRSRRRELVLTRSFTRAIQDKVQLQSPRPDGKECRSFFADRTNGHPHAALASTFDSSGVPVLSSRPSMLLSLYHNSNPQLPLHPIHRLPPELLVHVFSLGSVDDVMFPVLVSHVCHPWRAIALHAHSLWRRVSLSPDSKIHMWKERIRRARPCTLDVVLGSCPSSSALSIHTPRTCGMRHSDPFVGQLLISGNIDLQIRVIDSFNGPVEALKLETLTLRYPQNDDVKEFSLFGGFSPKLVRLTLEGVRLTWLPELFGNLVFLDYTHHGFSREEQAVDEILSMLQVSSRIRELKLCICHKATSFQALHLRRSLLGR
ncbi:hypothetical protein JVU11DRAFT_3588 [Chiua virens]|nr:hypothetical protein JVU11DRAFT_3588 [Chiua virens]